MVVCFRKGDQVLWRGRAVVSPPRDQQDVDQLHPLCKHPGETTEGNTCGTLPVYLKNIKLFRFIPHLFPFFFLRNWSCLRMNTSVCSKWTERPPATNQVLTLFVGICWCDTFSCFAGAAGSYCSRNWDGWLCWDDTQAGTVASQSCPDYLFNTDPAGEQRRCSRRTVNVAQLMDRSVWDDFALISRKGH